MPNRIKGITVEIGGDTTKLQTALKGVNGQIKNTQSALKDVERLLKLAPTNTTLLAQKQKLLAQAIGETKEKLNTLKLAASQANEQLQKSEITQKQYDALQREIAETENQLKKLKAQASSANATLAKIGDVGTKLEKAGGKISDAGKKVSVVSTAVAALGTASVKTAATFESSMSQVQATMGITKDSVSKVNGESVNTMDTLSDLAKQMGAETAFSASECAQALNYLALAGYDTQEMCDTLPVVLNLAAAGNIELASASDMVTDAMSALGMETKDAVKMVDQMSKTASTTNTSVAQLGEGILTIGATAKSIKGGTAELNTALGILANNGIKGAEGGTHLRNIILALQSPTDTAAASMESLGLNVYDSEGNMRSLNDILGDLNKSMDGMTDERKANIISNIFNKTDLSSVNALLANTGDTWDSLQKSISDSSDAAQQMADTQLDNLSGQLTILKSAVEGFAIAIGETLMPAIKSIVAKIQSFVDWINSLDEGTRQTIVKVGLVVAAFGPFLVILGTVISKVGVVIKTFSSLGLKITGLVSGAGGLSGVMGKLGAAIGGISAPVLAVVAVVGALIAAFVNLWKNNEEFRKNITATWNRIKETFSDFAQGITDRLNALGFDFKDFKEVVSAIWNGLCEFLAPVFEGVFNNIADKLSTVFGVITGILDVFVGLFTGDWSKMWEGIKGIFISVWEGVKAFFTNILNVLRNVADVFLGWFGTSWNEVWGNIKAFFVSVWNSISSFFTNIWNNIKNTVSTAVNAVKTTVSDVFASVKNIVTNIFDSVKSTAENAWNGICNVVKTGVMLIGSALDAAFDLITLPFKFIWENCRDVVISAWDKIQGVVSTAVNAVKNVISNVMNSVKSVFSSVWDSIKNVVSTAVNAVKNTVSSVMNSVKSVFCSVWSSIKSVVSTSVNAIKNTVSSVMNSVKSVFTSVWSSIKSVVSTAVNTIKNTVSAVFNTIKSTATTVWNGIKNAVTAPVNAAKTSVTGAFNWVKNTLANVFNSIKNTASSVWNGIKNAIVHPIEKAKNAIEDIVDKIKGFFNGLDISLPHIKLPHFSIEGELSISPPSVPHLDIDWYKEGGIMAKPTLFGMNGSSLMAGGEAGKEAILPLKGFYNELESILSSRLDTSAMEKYLAIIADNSSKGIYLEDGTLVGHLIPAIDSELGKSQKLQKRLSL